jgi:hypothetical protein
MTRPVCFAAAIVFAISSSVAMAAPSGTTRLTIAPRSTLVLNGSSNVAPWRCTGKMMSGEAMVAAPLAKVNEVIDRIEDGNIGPWMSNPAAGKFPTPSFAFSIPIDTLRCTGGKPMERDLTQTLKAARFPSIDFQLDGVRAGIEHDLDEHLYRTSIGGHLALAGVTRELTVPVSAERLSRTSFRLRAELPVRMTDFAIAPPTALFGMIKAKDALVVRFDLVLEAAP